MTKRKSRGASQTSVSRGNSTANSPIEEAEELYITSGRVNQSKKRRVDSQGKTTVGKKVLLELHIPDRLKTRLATDWKLVSTKQALVSLPREPTAHSIIQKYIKTCSPGERRNQEVMEGLLTYFDKALGSILLYRFERPQYSDIVKSFVPEKRLCQIYGAEHLLRLFVKLPELLSKTSVTEEGREVIQATLLDFLRFLEKKADSFFDLSVYETPTPHYIRLVG
mmetsp:Transcript_24447/g.68513  ORF Transcript_24447/g.68513 Transcript_24447/m.68513 type:complete len:223 (-) Transcript_24447:240-908(-)|eukprot:CAMPEP_0119137334 /NCGR_PEP_ID=MMETSP1310-20130426/23388_1 /TAXON_ID=464262 /ORGANISM="Genus nov. species nov., Strain RCC2339" /LENGTH=222 /DNA_ID=CAMNT_0007128413 /DNA_START=160 /DNA_END=828 /DNA_ORIENTATION=-